MKQTEKLKAIIDKALENGWDFLGHTSEITWSFEVKSGNDTYPNVKRELPCWVVFEGDLGNKIDIEPEQILFNHDFAKAFWGEEGVVSIGFNTATLIVKEKLRHPKPWEYHLQQAVISEDPITYYYDHL